MSYSLSGTLCTPNGLTSNRKFLPLHSSLYEKQCTYMMQYPGNSFIQTQSPLHNHHHPEIIKSFHSKLHPHGISEHGNSGHRINKIKSCC